MRIVLRYMIFTILSVLFVMPVFVSGQTDPGSARGKTTEQTTRKPDDKNSQSQNGDSGIGNEEIVFPDVANWQRGEIRVYDDPALGYSVPYTSKDGSSVSVFIYNGGNRKIADGINDKPVKDEMASMRTRLIKLGEAGLYQGVKEVVSDTVTLGGANGSIKALHSLFYFKLQGMEIDSDIFLFGYKNNFVKIHSTRPSAVGATTDKNFANLLAAMDKLFSK
jgi:hypothetical protein